MKTIIAGSRDYSNVASIYSVLDTLLLVRPITEVVSGTARGPDSIGAMWAIKQGIPVAYFPADWNKYGRGAGHIRNADMAKYADAAIIFWNGISAGTANMINLARKHGLQLHIEMI